MRLKPSTILLRMVVVLVMVLAVAQAQTFVPAGSGVAAAEGSSPCNITISTTNGNTLWVLGTSNTTGVTFGVTDSLGNITFTTVAGPHNNGLTPQDSLQVWQANLTASDASDIIHVTVSSTANWNSCAVVQYSSAPRTLDQTAFNNITGTISAGATIPTGTTATTAAANELLLGFYILHPAAAGGTYSPIASWTLRESEAFQQANAVIVERIVSATGAYQAGVTYTANLSSGVGVILTFKSAVVGPPPGQFPVIQ